MKNYTIKPPSNLRLLTDYKFYTKAGEAKGELYTESAHISRPNIMQQTFKRELTPTEEKSTYLIPKKGISRYQLKNDAGHFMTTIRERAIGQTSISQFEAKDGTYSMEHKVCNVLVKDLYVPSTHATPSYGFRGKLENFAHKLGNNKQGVERPVLRKVAGFLYKLAGR